MGTYRTESAAPAGSTAKTDGNIDRKIDGKADEIADEILAEIKHQLALIQYGSLEIQVHNGQVVQIERREKKRWEKGVNTR